GPATGPDRKAARRAGSALRRGAWALGALVAVALALTMGYTAAFHDRVPPGVHALGVDLGGLRQAEAQAALAARLDALARTQPVFRVDDREVALRPGAFGQPAPLAARLSLAAAQTGRQAPLGGLPVALRATVSGGTSLQASLVD